MFTAIKTYQTKSIVHLQSKQGKYGSQNLLIETALVSNRLSERDCVGIPHRSQNRVSRYGASGVEGESVDQVRVHCHESCDHACEVDRSLVRDVRRIVWFLLVEIVSIVSRRSTGQVDKVEFKKSETYCDIC